MEPAQIAALALTILSPYLKKGGEVLAEGIVKDIWESMKRLFAKEKKEAKLERLQSEPRDEESMKEIEAYLTFMLYTDSGAKKELEALVQTDKAQSIVQQNITGNSNVTIGGGVGGTVKIDVNRQK